MMTLIFGLLNFSGLHIEMVKNTHSQTNYVTS